MSLKRLAKSSSTTAKVLTMSNIKIEKNIPLPVYSKVPELPLDKMKIGESFVIGLSEEIKKSTIRQRVARFQKRNPPKHFAMRPWDDGDSVRIFRVEDY